MTTLVTPEPDAVHYGVPVSEIGEDGDLIAHGHHTPRRALAAFNAYARTQWGLLNLEDNRSATANNYLNQIHQHWGVFRAPDPDAGDEDPDWAWVLDYTGPDAPGAVPYTRIHL